MVQRHEGEAKAQLQAFCLAISQQLTVNSHQLTINLPLLLILNLVFLKSILVKDCTSFTD